MHTLSPIVNGHKTGALTKKLPNISHAPPALGPLQEPPQETFDQIIKELKSHPLSVSIESVLIKSFSAQFCSFWLYLPKRNEFYSPTYQIFSPCDKGILSSVYRSATSLCVTPQSSHPDFDENIDTRVVTSDASTDSDTPLQLDYQKSGVAGYSLRQCSLVLERSVRDHESYHEASDGFHDEPILSQPYVDDSHRFWTVVLRGRANPGYFRTEDAIELRSVLPFVFKSMTCSMTQPQFEAQLDDYEQRLSALLEVAEIISGVLDIDTLVPLIMEKACTLLNAERCSLFLVDQAKQELVSRFQGGLDKAIRMPIGRGIVGHTATTAETINILDAYQDDRFDKSIDIKTGYRTKSILCVPIYNNRGEIAGVTEMINKIGPNGFDEDDIKMLMAFNVFCGISLDNAKLYEASLSLTKQVRTFVGLSAVLGHTDNIKNLLYQILENIRSTVSAVRATLFLYDNSDRSFTQLINIGKPVIHGDVFAQEAIVGKGIRMFVGNQIKETSDKASLNELTEEYEEIMGNDITNDNNVNDNDMDKHININGRISTFLGRNTIIGKKEKSKKSENVICCIPLYGSDQNPLGIIEIQSNRQFPNEDIQILDCFAVFAAVSIERSQLIDLAKLGKSETELKQYIKPEERSKYTNCPTKLFIDDDIIWRVDFDPYQFPGIGHIKVLFAILYKFNLPQEFKITNEKLFKFFTELHDSYNDVPYHNWHHALDVTQFVTFEVIQSKLDEKLTKLELLALLVSSICHDVGHDGFTNMYNVQAETPLGILFKNQSVMETHHCQTSIDIISKEECNIFINLSPNEYSQIWSEIIRMILATDMARHFDILKSFDAMLDAKIFDMENLEHRILLMQMLLKCGDISNVSRPFNLADKWCDVLCEEFFRQGDLELANGMEYSSPLNDRAHLDKPKSQIGFYRSVCLPLFESTAKLLPELQCNVEQIESNLEKWKLKESFKVQKS
ncbi:3'5'-cyclic nucleotide phosphodiesterase family protein [Histomonas meleagridis]|nr:3'5'-cyclic nucleotide phosphodiesterase family protein [Histomonas meleagridis]